MATVTDHKLYSLLNNELSSYSDVVDTLLTDRKSSLDGGGYYNPAPELLSMNVDGATGVNVSNNIVLTFSENIEARSGHVTLTSGSEHISIPVSDEKQITVSGKTVTINPTDDLSAGKTYYLTVDYKAFVDGDGRAFGGVLDTLSKTDENDQDGLDALNFTTAAAGGDTGGGDTGGGDTGDNVIVLAVGTTDPVTATGAAEIFSLALEDAKGVGAYKSEEMTQLTLKDFSVTGDALKFDFVGTETSDGIKFSDITTLDQLADKKIDGHDISVQFDSIEDALLINFGVDGGGDNLVTLKLLAVNTASEVHVSIV
jgi:methionine-rich copper-binding protein CopC